MQLEPQWWPGSFSRQHRPFAILMPIDLLHCIYDPVSQAETPPGSQVGVSADNLVWVLGNWPGATTEVFSVELSEASGGEGQDQRQDFCGIFYGKEAREAYIGEGLAPDMRTLRSLPTTRKLRDALLQAEDPETLKWLEEAKKAGGATVKGGTLTLNKHGLLQFAPAAAPHEAQFYLPKSWRRDVIFYIHRQKNHARSARLADYIARTFWWPSLVEDVRKTLLDCHFCLVARARRLMKHGEYTSMKVESPHQGFGLDVWGPTVVTPEGYKYVLTLVDLFHGYVRFFPLRTKSSAEILSTALNYCWWHVGLPQFILTDFDVAFRSELSKKFCRAAKVEAWHTAPYSAWELGRVERRHQELNLAMKALEDKETWPHHLPGAVAFAYNTLKSTVTNVCPAEVEYGRLPRGPLELAMHTGPLPSPALLPAKPEQLAYHVSALRGATRIYTRLAKHFGERHREAGVRRKNREAQSTQARKKLKVGDKVAVERPRKAAGLPKKAVVQWRGPYTVAAVTRRGYRCVHRDGSTVTVSRPYLRPYTARVDPGQIAEAERSQPVILSRFRPGQLLAIGDHLPEEEGSRRFQLGRFAGFSEDDPDWLEVEYLATVTARPPYKFRNVWVDPADGKSILQKHKPRPSKRISRHVKRWTGVDPAAHVLKLGVPLELTASGGLPKPVLEALGPWKPHIMPH